MEKNYTKDKWQEANGSDSIIAVNPVTKETQCLARVYWYNPRTEDENKSNSALMASAADRHEQMIALTKLNWHVSMRADNSDGEEWIWCEPVEGSKSPIFHIAKGSWSDLPAWPESARQAVRKQMENL